MDYKTEFYLCLFGGIFGVHKFYKREYSKGLLYLCTAGLFMFGWISDCIKLFTYAYPTRGQFERREQREQLIKEEKAREEQLNKEGVAYCPRCKSISVQYVERRKQLSIGRTIVGGAIAGETGAILGGLSSKKLKGRVKCLKCGHEWKI